MNLIYSCSKGTNAEVFPSILSLYAKEGDCIADVTFGKGVFWKNVEINKYQTFFTDLKTGTDFRNLPYEDSSMNMVVLDPPYMHTPGGTAHSGHQNFEEYYKNNQSNNTTRFKYHDAVLRLYFEGIQEARRVLQPNGVLVIKCQDEVCAGFMRLTSMELTHYLVENSWTMEDCFVVMSNNRPGISRLKLQKHSRRNHSYFLVSRKKPPGAMAMRLSRNLWP